MNNNTEYKLPFMTQLQYVILTFGFIMGLFVGIIIMSTVADKAYEQGRNSVAVEALDIVCGYDPSAEE